MKPQDDRDKAARALQQARRQRLLRVKIKLMEYLYDCLDSGESIEGLAIRVDIAIAGGGLKKSHHDVCRGALKILRTAREEGAGRNEVMAYLRETAKHRV